MATLTSNLFQVGGRGPNDSRSPRVTGQTTSTARSTSSGRTSGDLVGTGSPSRDWSSGSGCGPTTRAGSGSSTGAWRRPSTVSAGGTHGCSGRCRSWSCRRSACRTSPTPTWRTSTADSSSATTRVDRWSSIPRPSSTSRRSAPTTNGCNAFRGWSSPCRGRGAPGGGRGGPGDVLRQLQPGGRGRYGSETYLARWDLDGPV